MGNEKFYGTPEGKFVAWQLERSGVLYGPDTVEARYLMLHFFTKTAFDISFAYWQGQRLIDVFTAAAAPYSDDQNRRKYGKSVLDQLSEVVALIDPFADSSKAKKQQNNSLTEEQKIELLNKVNSSGAMNLADAMKVMSDEMKQMQHKKAE